MKHRQPRTTSPYALFGVAAQLDSSTNASAFFFTKSKVVSRVFRFFQQCPFKPDLSGLYERQSLVNVLFPQEIHVQISF